MKWLKISTMVFVGATILVSFCGKADILPTMPTSIENTPKRIQAVEFSHMPAPSTAADMASTYAASIATVTYADNTTQEFPLTYHKLFGVKDKVGGNPYAAGQLYNYKMEAIYDPFGQPVIAETPDANSLLKIGSSLFLVSHLEYDWLLSSQSPSGYTRMPMSMLLTGLDQAPDGKLTVKSQKPLDFSGVNGLWIPCFGSQTPWNTHLGSEEDYDLQYSPLNTAGYKVTTAGLKALHEVYYKKEKIANPYHYGIIPEVTVKEDGSTTIVKHYAMGRGAWEMAKVMPDGKTAYLGDDGTHSFMAMFIADRAGDLSAGTLYAAKWTQISAEAGGRANLTWLKLGSGTDSELKRLADTATFNTLFDAVTLMDEEQCPTGYTRIRAGSMVDECLKVKAGQEKAAAFLESRRYAALKGATTEFTKMEGITVNVQDKRLYIAISSIRDSMLDNAHEPANDIRLQKVSAGAVYSADLKGGQVDTTGVAIPSEYVATNLSVEAALLGEDMVMDALGNTANPDRIANPDNIFFAEKMRILFISEDSSQHINNFIWAYHIDTRKLSRILSAVVGAENSGLQVVENMNGRAYIMSNTQHHGDWGGRRSAEIEQALMMVDRFDAHFGYIGGLPAIQ